MKLPSALTFMVIALAWAWHATELLPACPLAGKTQQHLARELNVFKNRKTAPTPSQINPNATLGAVLVPGPDLGRWRRQDGAVFVGVLVKVKSGGIESANCKARDLPHRDTHIELALNVSAPSTQRVVVEVTPYWRRKVHSKGLDWSTANFHQLVGRRVRVTGWLFDDLEHTNAAENTRPGGAHNWRATVWEIHPITMIEVLPDETP